MEMSIVTGIIERDNLAPLPFFLREKSKGTLGKSQVVLGQVDCRAQSNPAPLLRKWMELLKRTGLRFPWFSSSRSRWFPSGPLRREERGVWETYSTRSHCCNSPDILLTFELKFNGTHIPPPQPPSLSLSCKPAMIEIDGDKKEEVRVARLL